GAVERFETAQHVRARSQPPERISLDLPLRCSLAFTARGRPRRWRVPVERRFRVNGPVLGLPDVVGFGLPASTHGNLDARHPRRLPAARRQVALARNIDALEVQVLYVGARI